MRWETFVSRGQGEREGGEGAGGMEGKEGKEGGRCRWR